MTAAIEAACLRRAIKVSRALEKEFSAAGKVTIPILFAPNNGSVVSYPGFDWIIIDAFRCMRLPEKSHWYNKKGD
jgi:hypothetical protein